MGSKCFVLIGLLAVAALLFFSGAVTACDAAFGTCGASCGVTVQQQLGYAQAVVNVPQVVQVPQVVNYPVVRQQVVQQQQFVPFYAPQQAAIVQKQHVPVAAAPAFAPRRGRLFQGRSVARTRSVVRGAGSAQAQAQAGF